MVARAKQLKQRAVPTPKVPSRTLNETQATSKIARLRSAARRSGR
jgi:hypothetical protein